MSKAKDYLEEILNLIIKMKNYDYKPSNPDFTLVKKLFKVQNSLVKVFSEIVNSCIKS